MSRSEQCIVVSFTNTDPHDANRFANDMRSWLLENISNLIVEKSRENPEAQDFGSTLVLVLGTTAVTSLARGLASWLQRNSGARITIKTKNGRLIAEGLDSKDVPRIVEALADPRARNDQARLQ